MRNNKKDLVIVTNEPFPIGMAATNRLLTYTTEIAKRRLVKVLIVKPSENPKNIRNLLSKGEFNGISFEYLCKTTIWPKNSNKRKKIIILIKGYFLLFIGFKRERPKSVILISNNLILIWLVWIYSKIFGFNYFLEKSEKPHVIKNKANVVYKTLCLKSYRLFDGILVITNELVNIFHKLGQKNIFHLPMTVDCGRFNKLEIQSNERRFFTFKYCGGGTYERDGLVNMVKAFIDLKKIIDKPFVFEIIGPINKDDEYIKLVFHEIESNFASSLIKFIGKKSSEEIPSLLLSSDCLIMTPPKDFDSGGFPTKLGEYLATGVPVICTAVSEIPLYLNETNSLLVSPNNHQELVDKLEFVIQNYDLIKNIGKEGKCLALKAFNIESYINDLITFLKL